MKKLFLFILYIIFCRSFPTLGGFQQIDIATAEKDPEVQALIASGLQKIIDDGLEKGEFSSSNFELTKINSVAKQVSDGDNYKISCEFANDENVVILASFQATYQPSTQAIKMEYSYTVKKVSIATQVGETFVRIPSSEVQHSSEIQDLIKFGVNEVIQNSVSDHIIPDASYQISQVISVSRQVKEAGLFYKCSVNLESDEGIALEMNFTVYYQPLQGAKTLTDYTVRVEGDESENVEFAVTEAIIEPAEDDFTPLPGKEVSDNTVVKAVLDFGCQQITDIAINENKIPSAATLEVLQVIQAESQIVGNGIFYKFKCKLGDSASLTLTADFTVYIDVYTFEKKMTDYSYETSAADDNTSPQEEDQVEGGFIETELDVVIPKQEQPELEFEVEFVVEHSLLIAEHETQIGQDAETNGFVGWIFEQVFPLPDEEEIIPVIVEETPEQQGQEEEDIFVEQVHLIEEEVVVSVQEEEEDDLFIPILTPGSVEEEQFTVPPETTEEEDILLPIIIFEEEQVIVPVEQEQIPVEEAQTETEIPPVSIQEEDDLFIPIIIFEEEQIIAIVPAEEEQIQTETQTETEIPIISVKEEEEIFISTPAFEEEHVIVATEEEPILPETESEIETQTQTESVNEDGFVQLKTAQLQSDAEASDVFQFGVNNVIKQGIADGKIPDQEFMVTKVIKAERKNGENGNLYRFSCETSNTQGNSLLAMNFTVYYQFSSERRTLSSYSYNIKSVSSTTISSSSDTEDKSSGSATSTTANQNQFSKTGYTEVNKDEISYNSEIQGCIKFGAEQVIPNARSYNLSNINSVSRQVVDSAFYYKFDIELTQENKVADLVCTVYYQPDTDQKDVVAYSYLTKTASNNSTSSSSSSSSWWSSSSSWSSPSSSSSLSSSSSSSSSFKSFSSYKYSKISVATVESSSKYQELLNYGVDQSVKDLEDNKVVATTDFQISDVLEAYTQEDADYENFYVKVRLTGSAGISLDLDFNVQYQTSTDKKSLTSYSCEGSSPGQSQVLIADYKRDEGNELQVSNCEKIIPEGESTEVQDAINYGIEEVKKKVAGIENIDTSGYNVKEVKNVYREVVDDSSYKVDATLEDNQGSIIDCSFAVDYQLQGGKKNLDCYSYILY